jgi:hypothetical protein
LEQCLDWEKNSLDFEGDDERDPNYFDFKINCKNYKLPIYVYFDVSAQGYTVGETNAAVSAIGYHKILDKSGSVSGW